MRAPYVVYDVFTDRPFGGNPLAVFPEADGLPDDLLQPIAREFGFSETVFLFAQAGADARVRIFTPMDEVPFAGHPLIGAAVALSDAGAGPDLALHLPGGVIRARARDGQARFRQGAPVEILHHPDIALVARCLTLPAHSLRSAVTAGVGLPFVLVELSSQDCLAACRTDIEAFRRAARAYPTPFDFAVFAHMRDGDRVTARMFAPLGGIPEDPATGSACAALGAYLRATTGDDQSFAVEQGQAMGRPSRIGVEADATGVTISGHAVRVMEGHLIS